MNPYELDARLLRIEEVLGLEAWDMCGAESYYSGGVLARCVRENGHNGPHRGPGIGNAETMWPR